MSPRVCVLLGPYRNLTTLTSAALFLHPRCQVLNHQASQFFDHAGIDFIAQPSAAHVAAFVKQALVVAAAEGSLLESHAFRESLPALDAFRRLRLARVRTDIDVLLWKESLRVTNRLRHAPGLVEALTAIPEVRFLMPVRFPLDCARSNFRSGHVHLFHGLYRDSSLRELLDAILDLVGWFDALALRHPQSFLQFHEHELADPELLKRIGCFSGLPPETVWPRAAIDVFCSRPSTYHHTTRDRRMYVGLVEERFANAPSLRDRLVAPLVTHAA